MADPTTPAEHEQRLWQLAKGVRTAMLVTNGSDGLHARPMAPTVRPEQGVIWFLTATDTTKDDEIAADAQVCVTMAEGSTYIAFAGVAQLVDDRATIRDLWSPAAQAYYPGGPEDPKVIAIKVVPSHAQYWDGPATPVALLQMGLALLTGRSADPSGTSASIDMETGEVRVD